MQRYSPESSGLRSLMIRFLEFMSCDLGIVFSFFFSHLYTKLLSLGILQFIDNLKLLTVSFINWPGIISTVGFSGKPSIELKCS